MSDTQNLVLIRIHQIFSVSQLTQKSVVYVSAHGSLLRAKSQFEEVNTLDIEKTKQVTEGTYKVVLTGNVTSPEGKKEDIKATSSEITYSKK